MGKLYVVATPIGNFKDITLRALEILKDVQLVLAEDSREAKNLLQHFKLSTPVMTYHQHSSFEVRAKIAEQLRTSDIALVTDAGTPGISDPGNELVSYLTAINPELKVIPVPGASALTSLLSISGINMKEFIFLGFFPKKKHTKMFQKLQSIEMPFVFFESPYRIEKTLTEIEKQFPESEVVVGRELTKMYETIYRGTITQVLKLISEEAHVKGEFVVAVEPSPSR